MNKNKFCNINIGIALVLLLSISSFKSFAHFGSKGPFGGSITCGTTNGTTVFFGTKEGGVYESTSAALTAWRARPVGLKSGKITALAHTTSYLIAGTADSGVFIFNGFVGSDRYWNKINTGLSNLSITSLVAIDTISILVGTNGGGLYKTTNKGASWVQISSPSFTNAVISSLVKAGNRFYLTTATGVVSSDDNGTTWASFYSTTGASLMAYNVSTDELMVLDNAGLKLTGTASTASVEGFVSAQTGLPAVEVKSISTNGVGWAVATSSGVYASLTGTVIWAGVSSGLSGASLRASSIVPSGSSWVLGTDGAGIFKTSAVSISWVAMNTNFNNLETFAMVCKGNLVVVVANINGVFVSKDLATTYVHSNTGLTDSLQVTDLLFSGTNLFASTSSKGIFVSADTGTSWTTYALGLAELSIKTLAASASSLYAISANGIVFKSTGVGWVAIQTGLPSGVEPTSFAFHNGNVYLGTNGDGVFYRAELSGNWVAINNGLTSLNVTSLTSNGIYLFAGTDGAGVHRTAYSSVLWSATSPLSIAHTSMLNLDGSKIQGMTFNEGYVFAAHKGGLLASSDDGASWIEGGNQFNLPSFTDIRKISFVTTRVFVTTEYNSVYSNSLSELPTITLVPTSVMASKKSLGLIVSPNPNAGQFSLAVDNPTSINQLVILSAIGNEVVRYASFQENVQLELPAGLYYVQAINDAGVSQVLRMLVR